MVLEEDLTGNCPRCGSSKLFVSGYVEIEALADFYATLKPDGTVEVRLDNIVEEGGRYRKSTEKEIHYEDEIQCSDCANYFPMLELKAVIKAPTFKELQDKIHEGIECS